MLSFSHDGESSMTLANSIQDGQLSGEASEMLPLVDVKQLSENRSQHYQTQLTLFTDYSAVPLVGGASGDYAPRRCP
jgi:hypothetical protein